MMVGQTNKKLKREKNNKMRSPGKYVILKKSYIFNNLFVYILCTPVFCWHVCLCENIKSSETGVMDSLGLACGY